MTRRGAAVPAGRERLLRHRLWMLAGGLALAGVLIVGRGFQLQALQHERWIAAAHDQQRERVALPARRGGIYDRNGSPLALSHETFRLSVAPRELEHPDRIARRLRETLGLSAAHARRATSRKHRWVVLPGRFTVEQQRRLAGIRGLHWERRLERFYPHDDVGREVIGVVSGDGRALGGIEQEMDSLLRGVPGYSVLRRDARGGTLPAVSLPLVPPRDGADVYLTLDLDLQEIADAALRDALRNTGASGGDLLLVEPHTGDLLAAASLRPRGRVLSSVTEPYEPGSTLKPFAVAALLAERRATLQDSVFAENGAWRTEGGRTIYDVHPYGRLSLADALRVSSNVGIAKMAARLTPGEQYRYLRDLGFGTPTGVEYPSESGGRLRQPAQWSRFSPASVAMGYEVAVTPLQLAMAYGALANGGTLMQPRLVHEVRDAEGDVLLSNAPTALRRVLPRQVTDQLTEVLMAVVREGTATRANLADFEVAGKTGTARRTGAGGRYQAGSYTATFAGYFPARDPQVAIYVKLDEPKGAYYGGLTAAPVTRETLQAILAARDPSLAVPSVIARGSETAPLLATARTPADGRGVPHVFLVDQPMPAASAARDRAPVSVPDLAGMPLREAVRRLHRLGLHVRLQGQRSVQGTRPEAGTPLSRGDTVLLIGALP